MLLSKNAIAEYIMTGGGGAIFYANSTHKTVADASSSHASPFPIEVYRAGSPLAGHVRVGRRVARLQTNDESEKAMAGEMTPDTGSDLIPGENDLTVTFLAQGTQTGAQIATMLSGFIAGATRTLDIAAYDFRLEPETAAIVGAALRERAAAGVRVRIAYDSDRALMVDLMAGMDPALSGTETFVESLGYPSKGISGLKLMHNKYLVRDADLSAAQVWTGSTNLDDAAMDLAGEQYPAHRFSAARVLLRRGLRAALADR